MRRCVLVVVAMVSVAPLSGCAAFAVADAAVGTTMAVGSTAVNGTVGAGKLLVRGGGAVVRAVTTNSDPQGYECFDQADGQRVCYQATPR
ncbi:MAG: hypothetical protein AAGG69_01085 [Pseudomonadota bacterium]